MPKKGGPATKRAAAAGANKRIVNNHRPSMIGTTTAANNNNNNNNNNGGNSFLLEDYPPRHISTPPPPQSTSNAFRQNYSRNNNNSNEDNNNNNVMESFRNENQRLVVSEPLTNSAATRKQLQYIIQELQNEGTLTNGIAGGGGGESTLAGTTTTAPTSANNRNVGLMPSIHHGNSNNIRRGSGGAYRNTNSLYGALNGGGGGDGGGHHPSTPGGNAMFETSSKAYGKFALKNIPSGNNNNNNNNTNDIIIPPRAHSQDTYSRPSLRNVRGPGTGKQQTKDTLYNGLDPFTRRASGGSDPASAPPGGGSGGGINNNQQSFQEKFGANRNSPSPFVNNTERNISSGIPYKNNNLKLNNDSYVIHNLAGGANYHNNNNNNNNNSNNDISGSHLNNSISPRNRSSRYSIGANRPREIENVWSKNYAPPSGGGGDGGTNNTTSSGKPHSHQRVGSDELYDETPLMSPPDAASTLSPGNNNNHGVMTLYDHHQQQQQRKSPQPQSHTHSRQPSGGQVSPNLRGSANSVFSDGSDVLMSAQRELDFLNAQLNGMQQQHTERGGSGSGRQTNNNNNNNNNNKSAVAAPAFSMASPGNVNSTSNNNNSGGGNNNKGSVLSLAPHQPTAVHTTSSFHATIGTAAHHNNSSNSNNNNSARATPVASSAVTRGRELVLPPPKAMTPPVPHTTSSSSASQSAPSSTLLPVPRGGGGGMSGGNGVSPRRGSSEILAPGNTGNGNINSNSTSSGVGVGGIPPSHITAAAATAAAPLSSAASLAGFQNNNYECKVLFSSGKTTTKPLQICIGYGAVQGMRPTMEDAHFTEIRYNFQPPGGAGAGNHHHNANNSNNNNGNGNGDLLMLAGVCDGHCGRKVADLAAAYLPEMFMNNPLTGDNNALSLVQTILLADRKIYHTLQHHHQQHSAPGGRKRGEELRENISSTIKVGKGGFGQSIRGTYMDDTGALGGGGGGKNKILPEPLTLADYTLDGDFEKYSNQLFANNNSFNCSFGSGGGGGGGNLELYNGGSTLVMAALCKRILYVANLGDARAVLVEANTASGGNNNNNNNNSGSNMIVTALSDDHKPNNTRETSRVKYYGGFVQFGRVCGVLAVSRALGDFEFKFSNSQLFGNPNSKARRGGASAAGAKELPNVGNAQYYFATEHNIFHSNNTKLNSHIISGGVTGNMGNLVGNIPDIKQINITDSSKFLILACDGLWDVMTNAEAAQFVRDFLFYTPDVNVGNNNNNNSGSRPSQQTVQKVVNNCALKLAEFAVDRGSTDNVSVILIFFHDVVDVVASFGGNNNSNNNNAASRGASAGLGRTRLMSGGIGANGGGGGGGPRLSSPRMNNNANNNRTADEILRGSYRNSSNATAALFGGSRRF